MTTCHIHLSSPGLLGHMLLSILAHNVAATQAYLTGLRQVLG